jgi:D-alanine--poly(phosphoribitol) ligase subunit 1
VPILVQDYFSDSAARFPQKAAVGCKDSVISYSEMDRLTNAHARRLQQAGVSRGSLVPFFMRKSINSIKSILSVLKADCAYVPLDVTSPGQRLAEIVSATSAHVVIVDNDSEARFKELCGDLPGLTLINIDDEPDTSGEPIEYQNLSIDVAYVLFTSGSTGKPKGVMISHQMIVDYIEWCVDTYSLTDRDVIANHAPLYFDNSTFDLYTAFKTGATLHLVHDDLNVILTTLISWLIKRKVTVMFCVPSVMTILLKSGRLTPGIFPDLRHVIAAGEVLPPEVVRQWMQRYPHIQYTNMYGPTEITVDCLYHVIAQPPPADTAHVLIGKARRNMEVFVLLEDGTLSKQPGTVGEIVVRGKSVAYGYLNDPERTARAFIQNPQHKLFHDPLYRTGDLARIVDDGSFLFMGRRDHQIKYMGNRIELGEIEAVLLRNEGITEAIVVFNDSEVIDEKCIGALICLAAGVNKQQVLEACRRDLPGYMVPQKVVITDDLPRTPNGKGDRAAAFELVFRAQGEQV